MSNTYRMIVLAVLVASLLTACATPAPIDPTPAPQDGAQGALPPAGQAALAWIADVVGVPVEDIKVGNIEQVTWTDSCLGLGGPAESCLRADTPGFRITVVADGRLYTLHTDADGSAIRQVTLEGLEPVSTEAAGQAAVNFIAVHTGQPASSIQVVSVEAVDWPDACLGVSIPNVMCAQVITPGYRVSLTAGGQTYEVHTDLSASNMALAAQP